MSTARIEETSTAPQYRHASDIPVPWAEQMLSPFRWKVGHWAFFGAVLTLVADIMVGLYLFNFFGIARQFELQMWITIAGILGFISIAAALYAIVFKSGRGTGIFAFICAFIVGAPPAWLVGNTIIQFFANGGTLPDAPINW
ncbi:MAG: hypothetical protein ACTHXA_06345 [Gulosibacter sp.]|uniref:hypothetical protein n=1 Tax=Gulosibacter sp. TaxID=2817531 RepID=UPI003F8E6D94